VVETEDDGSSFLRFGDGVMGRLPTSDLKATYRVGNGSAGNVGAKAIAHVVTEIQGIGDVRNPLPATGGTDPEPIEQVRLYAPHAFRTQERAVTGTDYEVAAQRHREVQRATATRRWTGSWYTWFITVDRRGGRPVDAEFESELRELLERFRLAGYDLEVDAPRFVALDVALTVRVQSDYIRASVKHALLETFGDMDLPDGRRGFFHPDNFTFGQPVYLSQVVAAAMKVPGVSRVEPVRFQRWGEEAHNELQEGRITFDRLEIGRLDNDPNAPGNGKLELHMEGGL
jgi:predicted phage baseplate assembly protein